MIEDSETTRTDRSTYPPWKWKVFSFGCVVLVISLVSVGVKGISTPIAIAVLVSIACSTVLSVIYLIGRRTFWSKYDGREMAFAFAPLVLTSIVGLGFIGAILFAALVLH